MMEENDETIRQNLGESDDEQEVMFNLENVDTGDVTHTGDNDSVSYTHLTLPTILLV